MQDNSKLSVRLDKWLWAARFYKTRSLATQMVEGGKVHYNKQRVKASKLVTVGAFVEINFNGVIREFEVLDISERRQEYAIASLLYSETADSMKNHQAEKMLRRNSYLSNPIPEHRPNKKQRRELDKFRDSFKD